MECSKCYQISYRALIQLSQSIQFTSFNYRWEKYLQEFDRLSQNYMEKLIINQKKQIEEYQVFNTIHKRLNREI